MFWLLLLRLNGLFPVFSMASTKSYWVFDRLFFGLKRALFGRVLPGWTERFEPSDKGLCTH